MKSNAKFAADDAEDDDEPEHQLMDAVSDKSRIVPYVEAIEVLGELQLSAPNRNSQIDDFFKALHCGNARNARQDTILHFFFFQKGNKTFEMKYLFS